MCTTNFTAFSNLVSVDHPMERITTVPDATITISKTPLAAHCVYCSPPPVLRAFRQRNRTMLCASDVHEYLAHIFWTNGALYSCRWDLEARANFRILQQ